MEVAKPIKKQVQTGEKPQLVWLVTKGLDDGDKLIVKGVQMVRPGIEVTANEVKLEDGSTPGSPSPDGVKPAAK